MIFFSSDHHFGDSRFDILQRPFKNSDEYIKKCISNWNEKVGKKDVVYYLGDFMYGPDSLKLLEIAGELNGVKRLVRGNHDKLKDDDYLKFFDKVYSDKGVLIKYNDFKLFLNHYPTLGKRNYWNVVGHIHSAWKVQKNMINVGVDVCHFYPMSFESIEFLKNAICNFYDDDVWVAYDSANLFHKNRGKEGSYYNKK